MESASHRNLTPALIYLATAGILVGVTLTRIRKILKIRKKSILSKIDDGCYLAENPDTSSPFSFFRTIYIGSTYENTEKEMIICHEQSHVRHRHPVEKLAMSFLKAVFWFNPFIWIASRQLEEVQELEADRDVLSEGYDIRLYRLVIFKQLFGYYPEISCGLKDSLTKKRFIMMTQKKQAGHRLAQWASSIAIVAGTVLFMGAGKADSKPEQVIAQEAEPQKDTVKTADTKHDIIFMEVSDDGMVTLDGSTYTLKQLQDRIKGLTDRSNITVVIKAASDAEMGHITDLKEILRTNGILKIALAISSEDDTHEKKEEDTKKINRNDILEIKINAKGSVFANAPWLDSGHTLSEDGEILKYATDAIRKKHKTVILIQKDTNTDDQIIDEISGQLMTAIRTVREEYSTEKFKIPFEDLPDDKKEEIKKEIPVMVSMTEPHVS